MSRLWSHIQSASYSNITVSAQPNADSHRGTQHFLRCIYSLYVQQRHFTKIRENSILYLSFQWRGNVSVHIQPGIVLNTEDRCKTTTLIGILPSFEGGEVAGSIFCTVKEILKGLVHQLPMQSCLVVSYFQPIAAGIKQFYLTCCDANWQCLAS